MKLPPPITFADGQRKLYGIAAGAAGVFYGIAVLAGVVVAVWGNWPSDLARLQLYILAGCLASGVLGNISVTIGLLVGGPVGKFKTAVDKTGASIEVEGDASPSVTTTTTVAS